MPDIMIANPNTPSHSTAHAEHNVGLFHSYCEYPTGLTFQNQEPGETIILFARRHFITNVPWIIISLLLIIAPIVFIPFFQVAGILPVDIPPSLSLILIFFYYILVFAYSFANFLDWFYNIGIVTDRNIVDIDFSQLVSVHISATRVTQFEDVSYLQNGFFKTLFDYGDVLVQTAAEIPEFEFHRIPHPSRAVDLIRQLIGKKE